MYFSNSFYEIKDNTTVVDLYNGKTYKFATPEYAMLFFRFVSDYERSKHTYPTLVAHNIPPYSAPTPPQIIIHFGNGEQYALDLSIKPKWFRRILYHALGFKRKINHVK